MSAILADLTPEQRQAATHFTGPMLVVAGAGSGKTRVVTRRIAWLMAQGVKPWQILALTFTNKAAGEMKERVRELTGDAPKSVGTFHSQCARFLRFDVERLDDGRRGNFSIYDAGDQQGLIKQILKIRRLDAQQLKPAAVANAISAAKCQLQYPSDLPQNSWREKMTVEIYAEYERRLRETNAVDFDDLLLLTARMLERLPDLRAAYQRRFRFLLVDEYQDTNRLQYKLLRLLVGDENNLHATGDPDQSIYSWRGADYRNIMDFQQDFPGAKIVLLEQNYRSTGNILTAANHLIAHSDNRIEKNLFTAAGAGERIVAAQLRDDRAESFWVVEQILAEKAAGRALAAMAILYRMNAQSRAFEEALTRAKIPYQIVGGVRFYDRREVKDVLAVLKLRVNPADEISLRRALDARPVGVGAVTLDGILAQARAQKVAAVEFLAGDDFSRRYDGRQNAKLKTFCEWCRRLLAVPVDRAGDATRALIELSGLTEHLIRQSEKDPAWEDRVANIEALLNRAVEFSQTNPEGTLAQFLEDVALVADIDSFNPASDCLTLMTLHSAKGLEFDAVFLTGLEEGVLPHSRARFGSPAKNEEDIAEERRLFYVGITRARQKVYISHTQFRYMNGEANYAQPSSFLRELPQETLATVATPSLAAAQTGNTDNLDPEWDDDYIDDPFSE
ncbi:MAG: UvrD-helicase domain-containing protein [Planctomycetota bacterium]|jgi:DNA helicase-2/ATP-dependent DNA helicase PcrA|nr:UvrD-helicase domain-containing protein [Planctomycetota bacterium]